MRSHPFRWSSLTVLLIVIALASIQYFGQTHTAPGANTSVISVPVTYYVCAKAAAGTCVYNGDGGTVATSNDSGSCLTKAAPCATIAGAFTKINGKIPLALITVQLADTAGTGTDCYTPNHTTLTLPSYQSPPINPGSAMLSGLADAYPSNYVLVQGNTTTPGNVMVNGSGACTTRTYSTSNGLMFNGGIVRVRGMKFQGYGTTSGRFYAANAVSGNGTLLYVDDVTCTGNDDVQTTAGAECIGVYDHSLLKVGGTWSVSHMGAWVATNSEMHTTSPENSPSSNTSLTYTQAASADNDPAIECLEKALCLIDKLTVSWSGSGAYIAIMSNLWSNVMYAEWFPAAQCASSVCWAQTWNASSAIYEAAEEFSHIDASCVAGTQSSCTLTAGPAVAAYSERGSWINENVIANGVTKVNSGGCTNSWTGGGSSVTNCGDDSQTLSGASVFYYGLSNLSTHVYTHGTLNASGDVVCFGTSNQVVDCTTSATNPIGISYDTQTQPNILTFPGQRIAVNLDSTYSPSPGWFACTSATTAGKAIVQSSACAAGRQVGIVTASGSSVTSIQIAIQFR